MPYAVVSFNRTQDRLELHAMTWHRSEQAAEAFVEREHEFGRIAYAGPLSIR